MPPHTSRTRSLFPYELLVRLGKLFFLAQDFYWHNPSRLPTPAEWVTIRRTRVKEAVTHIWWLSKSHDGSTPHPLNQVFKLAHFFVSDDHP